MRGTAVNAAAAGGSMVLNLVLTSLLARNLAPGQFGTWAFLMVLTFGQGYFSLLDAGMSVSALRDIVRLRHSGDESAASEVMSTLRLYLLTVSVMGSLFIFTLGAALLNKSGVALSDSARTVALFCLAVRLLTDCMHSSNMTLLESASAFVRMRLIELSALCMWTLSVLFILRLNRSLEFLAISYTINGLLLLALSSTACRRIEPRPLRYLKGSRSTVKRLWNTGRWVALQRVSAVIYAQMDRTILALLLGINLVGEYEIPFKFQAMGSLLLSIFSSAIFPIAARLDPVTDRDQLSRLFHRATRVAVGLSVPMLIFLIFLSGPLIQLWLGSSFQHLSNSVSLFLLWPVIASFHVIGSSLLNGIGCTKELFGLATFSILINLILSLTFARAMGINGVILGTVIGYAVVFIPYLKVELKHFGAGLLTWIKMVVLPVLPAVCVQIPLLFFVRVQWLNGWSSLVAITFGVLSTLVGWAVFAIFEPDFRATSSLKKALSFGARQE